jgi:hypothetical protein
MFDFMKKKAAQKNAVNNMSKQKTIVSTETMSSNEYICAIENELLSVLVDRSMLSQFGIKDVFANGARVPNQLSYDDACHCMDSIEMILEELGYVSDRFVAKLDEASELEKKAICSADTLKNLCLEARAAIKIDHKERSVDRATLVDSVNTNLEFLPMIANNTFKTILFIARSHGFHMTGFTDVV